MEIKHVKTQLSDFSKAVAAGVLLAITVCVGPTALSPALQFCITAFLFYVLIYWRMPLFLLNIPIMILNKEKHLISRSLAVLLGNLAAGVCTCAVMSPVMNDTLVAMWAVANYQVSALSTLAGAVFGALLIGAIFGAITCWCNLNVNRQITAIVGAIVGTAAVIGYGRWFGFVPITWIGNGTPVITSLENLGAYLSMAGGLCILNTVGAFISLSAAKGE